MCLYSLQSALLQITMPCSAFHSWKGASVPFGVHGCLGDSPVAALSGSAVAARRVPMVFVFLVIAYGQYLLWCFYKARCLYCLSSLYVHQL